ncbi:MAG: hypothetical protein ACLU4N_14475 [Butyricimonas faecihominis]
MIIRFVMILLAGYPLLVSAGEGNAPRDGGYCKRERVDRKGELLPGVTIRLDSTTVGSVTGQDGTLFSCCRRGRRACFLVYRLRNGTGEITGKRPFTRDVERKSCGSG